MFLTNQVMRKPLKIHKNEHKKSGKQWVQFILEMKKGSLGGTID